MDFGLTWQQQTVIDELEKFLKKEVAPQVGKYDKKKILGDPSRLKEFFRQLQPFGAISGPIPEEYGGMGLDYTSRGLIFQKMAEYWASLAGNLLDSGRGCPVIGRKSK
jgi:alkylation response protein AidB-like acyl-CoA dehydrogenase